MAEIDFTFKFFGEEPVKRGRIHETIPPDVIHAALQVSSDTLFVEDFKKYFDLRLDEHLLSYEIIETGLSAKKVDDMNDIRRDIREIEENNPNFQQEFTDYLNDALRDHIY